MKTIKRFYENGYCTKFEATVLACQPKGNDFAVILDETYFYPEGGGQPADKGTLGGADVLHVSEKEGTIIHLVNQNLAVGSVVSGSIDWEYRFMLMQHHSGEHIVSGIIHRLYGYDNIGFHMGDEYITIDTSGELTPEQWERVEREANQAVYLNVPIRAEYPERLHELSYRSKKELSGEVRIVTVEGHDACACCGLHCRLTGEVGAIKFITANKYKAGTRIFIVCGQKAMEDYAAKNKSIYAISGMLSVKPLEVTNAVAKLLEENTMLKQQLVAVRLETIQRIADDAPLGENLVLRFVDMTADEIRRLCVLLTDKADIAAVFSKTDDNNFKYAMGSQTNDVRELGSHLNKQFSGRGGGKKELVQGSLTGAAQDIEQFIRQYTKK